jgi:hypothetical protein
VRVSCAQSLHRVTDAGNERPSPSGRARGGRSRPRRYSWTHACRVPGAASGPLGTVASSSARHGRLRRNAVSPHGVRLSGAPGAPLWSGCSSANRALAGKLLWDGIVAVPKVFGAGCPVLFSAGEPSTRELSGEEHGQPGGSAYLRGRGRAVAPPGRSPAHLPNLRNKATHGGTQGVAGFVDIRRLSERRESILAPRGAAVPGRGPSGFTQAARESWKDH